MLSLSSFAEEARVGRVVPSVSRWAEEAAREALERAASDWRERRLEWEA